MRPDGHDLAVPELPEVETARALLAEHALGRRIADVDDRDPFVCRPHHPGEIRAALLGRRFTAARRRGKTMWCETSGVGRGRTPGPDLGLHLGMGGRLIVTTPGGQAVEGGGPRRVRATPHKPEWDRFTIGFADGGTLRLFDTRRLGRVRLDPDLAGLGPDAQAISPAEFAERVPRGRAPVKARLLDQAVLAGVGNLWADELLWQAGVSPRRAVDQLSPAELARIYAAMQTTLRWAIDHGGVHTGEVIEHRRPGGTCPRCGAAMVHGTVGSRSTWWCPADQQ